MANGRKITRTEAVDFLKASATIKSFDNFIEGVCVGNGKPKRVTNFYSSHFNGYVFDLELLQPFIDGGAKFLVAYVAANPDEDPLTGAEGIPTIVLAGCLAGPVVEGKPTYKTLNIPYPALQHPPKIFVKEFPEGLAKSETQYSIEFKEIM